MCVLFVFVRVSAAHMLLLDDRVNSEMRARHSPAEPWFSNSKNIQEQRRGQFRIELVWRLCVHKAHDTHGIHVRLPGRILS